MTHTDAAISSIRKIEKISCDDVQYLLNVIASKMAAAGFSDLDLESIDEANGFITGEKIEAPKAHYQCAEEGAVQRFEAWMKEVVA